MKKLPIGPHLLNGGRNKLEQAREETAKAVLEEVQLLRGKYHATLRLMAEIVLKAGGEVRIPKDTSKELDPEIFITDDSATNELIIKARRPDFPPLKRDLI